MTTPSTDRLPDASMVSVPRPLCPCGGMSTRIFSSAYLPFGPRLPPRTTLANEAALIAAWPLITSSNAAGFGPPTRGFIRLPAVS